MIEKTHKFDEKLMKNWLKSRSRGSLGRSWGDLGGLGGSLVASGPKNLEKRTNKGQKEDLLEPFGLLLGPWGLQVGVQEAILAVSWASWGR